MLARTGMAWWLILIRAGPSEPTGFESVIAWRAWSQHTTEMCFRFRPMLSSVVAGGCRKPISDRDLGRLLQATRPCTQIGEARHPQMFDGKATLATSNDRQIAHTL